MQKNNTIYTKLGVKMNKIRIILLASAIVSLIQLNPVLAEETIHDKTEESILISSEVTEAVGITDSMELSLVDSIRYMKQTSREYWKLQNSIKELEESRKSAGDAKNLAELALDMPLGTGSGLSSPDAYLNAILSKNNYYTKQISLNVEVLRKKIDQLDKSIEISAKTLYYKLLASETTIDINKSSLRKLEEQLRVIQLKFNQGNATRLDVLNAEAAVQKSKSDLDSSVDSYELEKLSLLSSIGLPMDTEIVLSDSVLKYEAIGDVNLNEAIEAAKNDRVEILTAKNNLILQELKTHSVKAYYTSNLSVYKNAVYSLEDAQIAVPNTYKSVELDVRKSYQKLINSENSLLNAEKSVELAEETEKVTQLLYSNGMATTLDLLTAESSLKSAQAGKYNALVNYNINKMIFDNINIISSSN